MCSFRINGVLASVVLSVAVLFCTASQADLASYSGSLSTDDGGLVGSGGWNPDNYPDWDEDFPIAELSWRVDELANGNWWYSYTLAVSNKDISHIIVETSLAFTLGNLLSVDLTPINWDYELVLEADSMDDGDSPGIPVDSIYGIKFGKDGLDSRTWVVTFVSDRVPVWGDFYAKDGNNSINGEKTYLFNVGFSAVDPLAPPADGPLDGHLLRPDTVTVPVPVPGAVLLGSMGLGAAGFFLRRRKAHS